MQAWVTHSPDINRCHTARSKAVRPAKTVVSNRIVNRGGIGFAFEGCGPGVRIEHSPRRVVDVWSDMDWER